MNSSNSNYNANANFITHHREIQIRIWAALKASHGWRGRCVGHKLAMFVSWKASNTDIEWALEDRSIIN